MLNVNKNLKDLNERDPYDATKFLVGDIIDASFQYSARIVYFYEIVRITTSTIFCKRLKNKVVDHDGYGQNGTCVPIENEFESEKVYSGRINKKSKYVKIDGCLARLWDGTPSDFYTD